MEKVEAGAEQKWIEIVTVDAIDRWTVYHRLQQLSIPCRCDRGQPLQVQANNATVAIQVWSAIKQVTASRQDCLAWLERCWEAS